MKKSYRGIGLTIIFFVVFVMMLSIRVSTSQCVNYQCQQFPIPLYLKMLDFFDRHLNYKRLAESIATRKLSEKERVRLFLAWTVEHIKSNPPGLPVVDDHAWHIIVRGYGVDDQFQDVFTTLCNYAGADAFFDYFKDKTGKKKPLSMVKIEGEWCVFDAYNGIYFRNNQGQIASIKDILKDNYQLAGLINMKSSSTDYKEYFYALASLKYDDWYYYHSAIQFPLRRLIFWGKKKK